MYKEVAHSYDDFVDIFNLAKDSLISGERLTIILFGDEFYTVVESDGTIEVNWYIVEDLQHMSRITIDKNLFVTLREDAKTSRLYFDIYKL